MEELSNAEFLHALFVLKSLLGSEFGKSGKASQQELNIPEYVLMKMVSNTKNVSLSEVREYLSISKAAVSQILSTLEKRALIVRNIDPSNRRNLIVSITPFGASMLQEKDAEVNVRMGEIVSRIGKKDTMQFIRLIQRINDAMIASE